MNDTIKTFLNKRAERLNNIEIAATVHKEIGARLQKGNFSKNLDVGSDELIYQFFACTQKNAQYVVFSEFVAVIGPIEQNTQLPKAWKDFNLTDANLKELRQIYTRYAEIRHHFISHIGHKDWAAVIQNSDITYDQTDNDISTIRNILNTIRINNSIAPHVQVYESAEQYPVRGVEVLFSLLTERNN